MSDGQSNLEITIRTIADEHGIQLTQDGLQQVKERVQQLGASTDKGTAQFTGFTEAQKDQAKVALFYAGTANTATQSTNALSESVHGGGRAFMGLKEVIGGIEFNRPAEAIRGLVNLTGAAGIGLRTLASGFSADAIAAGPILVAVGAMREIAAENEKAIKRMFESGAKAAEDYKARHSAVVAAAEKELKGLLDELAQLSKAYNDVIADSKRLQQNSAEIMSAQKDLALAQASTPEEKAAVEAKFSGAKSDTDRLNAGVNEQNARESLLALADKGRSADEAVSKAQNEFDSAKDASRQLLGTPASDGALARAKAAKDALDAAMGNRDRVRNEITPAMKTAQDQIDAAQQSRAVGAIRKQTETATAATKVSELSEADVKKITGLRAAAQTAMESGDFATQDALVAELKNMHKSTKQLAGAINTIMPDISASLAGSAEKTDKIRRDLAAFQKNQAYTNGP